MIRECPSTSSLSSDCSKGNCADRDFRMCNGKITACYTIGSSVTVCPNVSTFLIQKF